MWFFNSVFCNFTIIIFNQTLCYVTSPFTAKQTNINFYVSCDVKHEHEQKCIQSFFWLTEKWRRITQPLTMQTAQAEPSSLASLLHDHCQIFCVNFQTLTNWIACRLLSPSCHSWLLFFCLWFTKKVSIKEPFCTFCYFVFPQVFSDRAKFGTTRGWLNNDHVFIFRYSFKLHISWTSHDTIHSCTHFPLLMGRESLWCQIWLRFCNWPEKADLSAHPNLLLQSVQLYSEQRESVGAGSCSE